MDDRFPCPCCGFLTLPATPPGTFEICPVCFWQDDPVQHAHPDYRGGANEVSLNEARRNFRKFGVAVSDALGFVRAPRADELPLSIG